MTRAVIPRVCFHDKLYGLGLRGRRPIRLGEKVTGYRYIAHLYCLAVEAGFYSDVPVCLLKHAREPGSGSPPGKKEFFFACYWLMRINGF